MKNLVIATVALLALSFASCKKEYVCECDITRTSGGSTLTTDDGKYTYKDTRARAEDRCNDQEESGDDAFGPYSRECQIR